MSFATFTILFKVLDKKKEHSKAFTKTFSANIESMSTYLETRLEIKSHTLRGINVSPYTSLKRTSDQVRSNRVPDGLM